jgi:uncharacterized protein (DUF1330 family)
MTRSKSDAPAYAVGLLREVKMGPEVVAYLAAIDRTLEPFGGRFVIHGGEMQVMEGRRPGDLIVIAFPDRARAEAWYRSPAYREILPLRLRNATGDVFLIDGVAEDHVATDILAA